MGSAIRSRSVQYSGGASQIKQNFELLHNGQKIFEREFGFSGINTTTSVITCQNHFFVSGEELKISGAENLNILPTVISGISTTKLPNTVYAIKLNNSELRFASTAKNALKYNPEYLKIISAPVDVECTITSVKQNSKSLISLDNVIQSPIKFTSYTTTLNGSIDVSDSQLVLNNLTNFKNGDILKIDDELIKIKSIKLNNSSATLVTRGWLGTTKKSHSNGSIVRKFTGNYNIVKNIIYFDSPPLGINDSEFGFSSKSTFSGRVFIRSGIEESDYDTYNDNQVFDDLSSKFINLDNQYTLKSNGYDVNEIEPNGALVLIKQIPQTPQRLGGVNIIGDYYIEENLNQTKLNFTGSVSHHPNDISASSIPIGGQILRCELNQGSGYQNLVSAGGTSTILGGSISSVSIGNSGSGYKSNRVNISTILPTSDISIVGFASVSNGYVCSPITITNPGFGYTTPPPIIFDAPIGYNNIPLKYSSISSVGIGSSAAVDIYVNGNGDILEFKISNPGYGYKVGEILTAEILKNSSLPFSEFRLQITDVESDEFSAWSFGELELLDPIDSYFNGTTTSFKLRKNGVIQSFKSPKSNLDPGASILVFINNILQVPNESYIFTGGSTISFTEPPKYGDISKIIFYRGTKGIDIVDVDILEKIQIGDYVKLNDDNSDLTQEPRLVMDFTSVETLLTNPYSGPGLSFDVTYKRPIELCKSKEDKYINNKLVTKNRIWYEPIINPVTNIIQSVGIGTTAEIFVESVKTFFDNNKENYDDILNLQLIDQSTSKVETFIGSSYEGDFGSIIGISTSTLYPGYNTLTFDTIIPEDSFLRNAQITESPIVRSGIQSNYYFVVTNSNIGNGVISLRNNGTTVSIGSSFIDNVYQVVSIENVTNIINTTTVVSSNRTYTSPTIIDTSGTLIINEGVSVTISGIDITKITVRVNNIDKISQDIANYQNSEYFGNYSWGRVYTTKRRNPKSFTFYPSGVSGIQTSAIMRRYNSLRYNDYK